MIAQPTHTLMSPKSTAVEGETAEGGTMGGGAPQGFAADSRLSDQARSFHHARNKTGIVGGKKLWSDDASVNALWMRLSEPEGNDVPSIQRSFVRHVITTLTRTYFNMDNFASYQAAAHAYAAGRRRPAKLL